MTNNSQSVKKNLSSIQVLKTLHFLLEDNYNMRELLKKLNENEPVPIFNNSVVSKYINTCRYLGFEIPKINSRYYVTSIPFGFSYNNNEIDLISNFKKIAESKMSEKALKLFNSFIEKINRYASKKISKIEITDSNKSLQYFENAVRDKNKVKLIFKNKDILECVPIKILDSDGKTFFVVFKGKIRMVDSTRLVAIEILSDKFVHRFSDQTTLFKLRGDLAKRYQPRENERIRLENDGTIIVINVGENKETLFSRLLRYDSCCEILNPKVYREEFVSIIDSTLKNYGEE